MSTIGGNGDPVETLVSTVDLAHALDTTTRSVLRRATAEAWLVKTSRRDVGGVEKRYPISSLPPDVQQHIMRRRARLAVQTAISVDQPSPARQTEPAAETAAQRQRRLAREMVLAALRSISAQVTAVHGSCSVQQACALMLQSAQAGNLPEATLRNLRAACDARGRDQLEASGLPSARSLQRWMTAASQGRSLVPVLPAPALAVQPWQPLAIELRQRPQGSTLRWLHGQLLKLWEPSWGAPISYDKVARFFRSEFSATDQLKGRHTGSALRALTVYQRRSAAGMQPWDEIHADGWTSHFTAPHPVSGEFRTYEVWHFHDVATRYLCPLSIGLTENTDVITEGLRLAIEVGGVPAVWQTDSTSSVKNDRIEHDLHASLAERLGLAIVHPAQVGNSQANGIAENFNTWLDKQARELATYQHPERMDSGTYIRVRRLANAMVKAGDPAARERHRMAAVRLGKGIVFNSHQEAVDWLRDLEHKWNHKPHRSLPKVTCPQTGRAVHQTPAQALAAARQAGWRPVHLSPADLVDAFRPHLKKRIRRGAVTTVGGTRYHHDILPHHEGEEVLVAVDVHDPSQVWVKDLQGRLLCIAPLLADVPYRSPSMAEHAQAKRAAAQIKRREQQIAAIEARLEPPVVDVAALELSTPHVLPIVASAPEPEDDAPDPIELYLQKRRIEDAQARLEAQARDLARIEAVMRAARERASDDATDADDDPPLFNAAVG